MDDDPVGIDEKDLAVGDERPGDDAGVEFEDITYSLLVGVGLDEGDRLAGVDTKTVPVDDEFIGSLINSEVA